MTRVLFSFFFSDWAWPWRCFMVALSFWTDPFIALAGGLTLGLGYAHLIEGLQARQELGNLTVQAPRF